MKHRVERNENMATLIAEEDIAGASATSTSMAAIPSMMFNQNNPEISR